MSETTTQTVATTDQVRLAGGALREARPRARRMHLRATFTPLLVQFDTEATHWRWSRSARRPTATRGLVATTTGLRRTRFGIPPSHPLARERWIQALTTVAAYRSADDNRPLGSKGGARKIEAITQRNLAAATLTRASRLTHGSGARRPELGHDAVDIVPAGGRAL
jgi:hypothetical protein